METALINHKNNNFINFKIIYENSDNINNSH